MRPAGLAPAAGCPRGLMILQGREKEAGEEIAGNDGFDQSCPGSPLPAGGTLLQVEAREDEGVGTNVPSMPHPLDWRKLREKARSAPGHRMA